MLVFLQLVVADGKRGELELPAQDRGKTGEERLHHGVVPVGVNAADDHRAVAQPVEEEDDPVERHNADEVVRVPAFDVRALGDAPLKGL